MPFGMGPAGWAYMSSYAYPYASSYPYSHSYPYAGISYPVWSWLGGWGRGRGRGFCRRWFMPYWYDWW